jgi:hypothetical protein
MMDEKTLRAIIEETVTQTLEHVGFTIDKPNHIQADMIYLRKAREGSEEVQKWFRRTAISVAVTGTLYSLWKGIRSSF